MGTSSDSKTESYIDPYFTYDIPYGIIPEADSATECHFFFFLSIITQMCLINPWFHPFFELQQTNYPSGNDCYNQSCSHIYQSYLPAKHSIQKDYSNFIDHWRGDKK